MKRINNIYYKELTLSNLHDVYKDVYRTTKNKREIFEFHKNKNINLYDIFLKLHHKNYKFKKYNIFMIVEPKKRIIMSQPIDDKIVNHFVAIHYLNKYLEKSLIHSNVATRKGKGTSLGHELFKKYITKDSYILKLDISKYFYNIDHDILFNLVEKKIKDQDVLNLLRDVLDTTNEPYVNRDIRNLKRINSKRFPLSIDEIDKIPNYAYGKGVSIGNMTSQILAVFYLSEVDHFIKQELKFKKYIRYMDDLVIISEDKLLLNHAFDKIVNKVKSFKLDVNDKCKIYNIKTGVEFLGYRYIYKNRLIIKYNKKTKKKINKNLKHKRKKDIISYFKSLGSYQGYLRYSTTKLKERYIVKDEFITKYNFYKKQYTDSLIIVKHDKKYKSSDFKLLWYLFDIYSKYKISYIYNIDLVLSVLELKNINYIIVDNEAKMKMFDNNKYTDILDKASFKYDKETKKRNLHEKINEILDKDVDFYENIYKYLNTF